MTLRKWTFGLLGVMLAAAGFQPAARGAEPQDSSGGPGKPYLVIVGAGEFKDPAIHKRPTADGDAKALHALLTAPGADGKPAVLGVPTDRAKLLTSADATKESIVKAVEAAVENTTKDDLIVLAFFGRGSAVAEKPCFFTGDTAFKDRAKAALTPADLEPAFKKLKGQKLLVLMDVAYKGFDAGDEKVAEPSVGEWLKLTFGDEDGETGLATNRVLVFGNQPFREPLVKGGHGLFYAVLADALGGRADHKPYFAGYESDGLVTVYELAQYLEKEIPNGAREVAKTDKEKEIVPVVIGQQTSRYWVTRDPEGAKKADAEVAALAAKVKAGDIPEEAGKEGAALLFRMPKLKWQQELRKAYQGVAAGKVTAADLEKTRKDLEAGRVLPAGEATAFAEKVNEWVSELSGRYIKPVTSGELTAAAIKGLFLRAEETLPAELAAELEKPKELTAARQAQLLARARDHLKKREDLDGDKAVDLAIMMASGSLNDRYTLYTDKDGVLKLQSQLRGRFPGVGIQIRRDPVRDGLLVATPIKGSPAYRAGIQAGDLITEIRLSVDTKGNPLAPDAQRVFSTKGMKSDDAVNLILGKANSPITLVVQRDGFAEPKPFELKRDFVLVETVHGVQRDDKANWSYFLDDEYKIGYVRLTQFISVDLDDDGKEDLGTFTDLKKAIAEMKKAGLNGFVLDLRDNPGGFLSSAVNISGLFVGPEKIVTVKPRVGSPRTHYGRTAADKSFEMIVLVNEGSASASEIVAAALQDYGRAVIVGERSYGKGSVQDVVSFRPTGGEIKYTYARYYPPLGRNIDKLAAEQDPQNVKDWGVKPTPGFEVKFTPEELAAWYEYSLDLAVIPPPGRTPAAVTPAKDKQLLAGLEHLRKEIDATGKGPKKK